MEGSKADAAFAGTVLLCETLARLGVRFAVNGFQDRLIPFVDFDDGLPLATRNRFLAASGLVGVVVRQARRQARQAQFARCVPP